MFAAYPLSSPEMLDAMRKAGWHNYSLFIREDGSLFGYFEAEESFAASLTALSKEEVISKWHTVMAPFFEGIDGTRADESLIELEELFHLA
ncbi:MAG: L-rhamnose mutarotase [Chloroflexi bacterium]|nr:L-rhamnose mutarotase [Chloroflexota bacterium]